MARPDHRADRVGLRCSLRERRGYSRWRPHDRLRAVSMLHGQLGETLTSKSFRDLLDAIWTPGSLRVNDSNSTFSTALLLRQLSDDGHGVGKLSLAATW